GPDGAAGRRGSAGPDRAGARHGGSGRGALSAGPTPPGPLPSRAGSRGRSRVPGRRPLLPGSHQAALRRSGLRLVGVSGGAAVRGAAPARPRAPVEAALRDRRRPPQTGKQRGGAWGVRGGHGGRRSVSGSSPRGVLASRTGRFGDGARAV